MGFRLFGHCSIRVALSLVALAASSAHAADCSPYTSALRQKMDEYVAYRNQNLAQQTTLSTTETTCRDGGTTIANRVAKMASALSCQAEMDASGLDGKIKHLGGSCQTSFNRIHAFQLELRAHYEVAKGELDEAMRVLEATHILDFDCGSDLANTKQAVVKFVALEGDIVHVRDESKDGEVHYGKVKDLSAKLEAVTGGRGTNCGEAIAQMSSAFSPDPHGFASSGGASAGGRAPSSASDVTGVHKPEGKLDSGSPSSARVQATSSGGNTGTAASAASSGKIKFDASDAAKEFTEKGEALSASRTAGKATTRSIEGSAAASVKELLSQAKAFGAQDLPLNGAAPGNGVVALTGSTPELSGFAPIAAMGNGIEGTEVDLFARVHTRYRSLGF